MSGGPPAGPQKVGFPAFGQQYQPVSQFNQYAPPAPAPVQTQPYTNGGFTNGAPQQQPYPQQFPGAPAAKPAVNGFPAAAPQQYGAAPFPGAPAQQNGFAAPPPAAAAAAQPNSAFKPYGNTMNGPAQPSPSPFPGAPPAPASAAPNAPGFPPPGPSTPVSTPAAPQFPGAAPLPAAPAAPSRYPQPPQPIHNAGYAQPGAFPGPAAPPPQPTQPMPQMQGYPGQQQGFGQQPGYGQQQQPAYGGAPSAQMQAMGLGAPPQQMARPGGDIVDISIQRDNFQLGTADVQVQLPVNLANNQARMDTNVFRSTLSHVPQTEELLKKSRLPFGLTLQAFRDLKNLNVIQTSTIVRCRYCRTYINPYVNIPDQRHWRCNLCNRQNDLPDDFSWDPATKQFGDPTQRPEIQNATVEYIAPSEYMLRPPQPPVYVFVMDVSAAAIECGYLFALSEQILVNLEQMPGDDRAMVAFVGVDSALHFYRFHEGKARLPTEMVVDDVDEAFLPSYDGLLVSLKKNRESVRQFVQCLPKIFERAPSVPGNCLGAALNIVHQMIGEVGGRISVFQSSLPTTGPGALQPREDPNQRASGEVQNLGPATDFYKRLALECTGHQVALDLFLLNSQYADLATLSEMSKFSSGCVYHFPNYHVLNDVTQVKRFERIVSRYLTRKIGFEAVLRIRCSRGLALSAFFGNFFVRSTDLLALANVNPDSAIAVQVHLEEKLSASNVCFQAALLYTSSKGDRRIRVHTMCLPTTAELNTVYTGFDVKATVSLLSKLAVDRSMAGGSLADSREATVNAVVDSLGAYQRTIGQGRGGLIAPLPGHLRLFPMYALGMLKHPAMCAGGRSVKLDDRVGSMLLLRHCPLEQILSDVYPVLHRLNDIPALDEGAEARRLPLSFEHVHRDGVYLMEAGSHMYMYVGSQADPQFLLQVFGKHYQELDENSWSSCESVDTETSRKVRSFVKKQMSLKFYLSPVQLIREDSRMREEFVRRMVDDRSESTHSYVEFLQHVKREISGH